MAYFPRPEFAKLGLTKVALDYLESLTVVAGTVTNVTNLTTNVTNIQADLTTVQADIITAQQAADDAPLLVPMFYPEPASAVAATSSSWIPAVTGAEPVTLLSDGAGQLILVAYP